MSRLPEQAEEPKRLFPKRAPSSSAQSTSRTVTGGLPSYSALIRRRISRPASVFRATVEPAAVRHGIDVAADEQRLLRFAAQRHPEIAGFVALRLPRPLPLLCLPASCAPSPRSAVKATRCAPFSSPVRRAQFLEFLDRAARIQLAHAGMLENRRHNATQLPELSSRAAKDGAKDLSFATAHSFPGARQLQMGIPRRASPARDDKGLLRQNFSQRSVNGSSFAIVRWLPCC